MPSWYFKDQLEPSSFPNSAALKAHKALPRRRIVSEVTGLAPEPGGVHAVNHAHTTSAGEVSTDVMQSWTSVTTRPPSESTYQLPLTPPTLSSGDGKQNPLEKLNYKANGTMTSESQASGLSSPINQRSLPTPDSTPPRKHARPRDPSPSSISRQASPRADSFTTAREGFSDDEDNPFIPVPSNLHHLTHNANSNMKSMFGPKNLGLGLGLESDEDRTPKAQTPIASLHAADFNASDGAGSLEYWKTYHDRAADSKRASKVSKHHRSRIINGSQGDGSLLRTPPSPTEDSTLHATDRSTRYRGQKTSSSPLNALTERFARQIDWPLDDDAMELNAKVQQVDNRRFSQISATSTVIEAVVLSTPPQRRQTLRHISKVSSLREASSLVKDSGREPIIGGQKRRLVHRNTKITERGNRASTTSAGSTSAIPQEHRIAEAMVPQRQSSLKADKSRRSSKSLSPFAHHTPGRPNTAPNGPIKHFDVVDRRNRPLSDPVTASRNLVAAELAAQETGPLPTTRSSSRSVPTSRNVSRPTSLTSTSLHNHNLQNPPQLNLPQSSSPVAGGLPLRTDSPTKSTTDDWLGLRPRSTLVTPFSMASMNSSTPGTLELNEATAMSIYPHNNKSVLIVQQARSRGSDDSKKRKISAEVDPAHRTEALIATVPQSRQLTDSPLRYPRNPPPPPEFALIPPTPASQAAVPEANSSPRRPHSLAAAGGRHRSALKRAFSTRRYSETFVDPLTGGLLRRNTTGTHRQTSETGGSHHKLSPFWRPRGFWDGFSDSDSDFGNDGPLVSHHSTLPQPRHASNSSSPFSSSISRRFGSLGSLNRSLRFSRRMPRSVEREDVGLEMGCDGRLQESLLKEKRGGMGNGGHQVGFGGLGVLMDGFERRRVKREEERREKERGRIRRSIGPVLVNEGL